MLSDKKGVEIALVTHNAWQSLRAEGMVQEAGHI